MKRSQNNETQLQRAVSRYFKIIKQQVLTELEEYWSDYQLVLGQIDLMTRPIMDSHEQYYSILEKFIRREFGLGKREAERLVKLSTPQAHKAIRPLRFFHNRNNLFGTLKDAENDLLSKVFVSSKQTLARVTGDINQIITQGYTEGKGIDVVTTMLTTRFNQLETWEAQRIARTEIHNAHNNAVIKTYDALGVEYTQWIAANDDRTRDSHAELDGEIIRMGDTYSNGLAYPGDTSGDIEEWVNCRCSNAPYVMPSDMMAPPGMQQFREEDLIPIS